MALDNVPATAKIRELRLGVRSPNIEARRGINLKAAYAPAAREYWAGQILWADLSRADMAGLIAFFEALDGRVTPFGVSLAAGFASQYVAGAASASGTISAAVQPGADRVKISISGSPSLLAGTLIGIGDTAGTYQLCEVLTTAAANGSADIIVAPRIRSAFAASTAVAAGTVTGKFKLQDDTIKSRFVPAYGSLSIDVVEAL